MLKQTDHASLKLEYPDTATPPTAQQLFSEIPFEFQIARNGQLDIIICTIETAARIAPVFTESEEFRPSDRHASAFGDFQFPGWTLSEIETYLEEIS
jgi:hypothetical protein